MPTLFTDPRSGGVKKSSGVNVLPIVKETWEEVRDDNNPEVDWLIAGYDGSSKRDITILAKGHGGLKECSNVLPDDLPVFGGLRLNDNKFATFFYVDEQTSVLKKGRASMHKNGVMNVLEGCVMEIDIWPGMTKDDIGSPSEIKEQPINHPERSSNNNIATTSTNSSSATSTNTRYTGISAAEPVKKPPTALPTNKAHNNHHDQQEQMGQRMKSIDINTDDSHERSNNTNRVDQYDQHQQHSSSSSYCDDKTTATNTTDATTATTSTTEPNPTNHHVHVAYAEIKGISNISDLPSGVDPLNREASLSDEEFYLVFDIDKESFYKLPAWKRTNIKKAKLLF